MVGGPEEFLSGEEDRQKMACDRILSLHVFLLSLSSVLLQQNGIVKAYLKGTKELY